MVVIKLIVFLVGCYLISRIIISKKELSSINSIPIHLFIGVILLTYVYYLCKYFNWPIIVIYLVLIIVLIAGLINIKKISFNIEKISFKKDLFFLALIYFTVSLPIIIQSLYMFGGNYPKIIYNVDSAFFLQFVHGFIESNHYPPELRLSLNEGFNYHYGSMASAAMISEVTGLQPHNSFLVILPILAVLSFISITIEIIKSFLIKNSYLVAAILLLGFTQYGFNYLHISNVINTIFTQEQFFYTQFTQIPTAFGFNICLLILLSTLKFDEKGFKILAVLLLGLIAIFKIPFAFFIGVGVGLYAINRIILEKRYIPLLYIMIGGFFMILNYLLFIYNPTIKSEITLNLFGITKSIVFSIFIFSVFLFLTYLFSNSIKEEFKKYHILLLFVLPSFFLGSIFNINNPNTFQLVTIVPFFYWLFVLLIFFSKTFTIQSIYRKTILIVFILILTMPCFIVTTNFIVKILRDPINGHEYCNNDSIAQALQGIPTSNTLIATNDLRYPANSYKRDNRQFQISALFGHRAFNAEMSYTEFMIKEFDDRKKITEHLKSGCWDQLQINELIRKHNITHILIHKSYPYSKNIPFHNVFENSDYIVYNITE